MSTARLRRDAEREPQNVKRANKSLAVDLHCHVHTLEADEIAKQTQTPSPHSHGAPWQRAHWRKAKGAAP